MPFKKSYRRYGRKLKSSMPASLMRSTAGLSAGANALLKQQLAAKARTYVTRQSARRVSRVVKQKKESAKSGGIKEFDTKVLFTGKRISPTVYRNRLLSSGKQNVIFQFRGIKNFDDYGFYGINQQLINDPIIRVLPVYSLLLNGVCQNYGNRTHPLRRLYMFTQGTYDGRLAWDDVVGFDKDGNQSPQLQYSSTNWEQDIREASLWQSSAIKLNLWGAKSKAVKFIVQIVKFWDEECESHHGPVNEVVGTKAQQFWESQLKQLTFSPIDKIDWKGSRKCKVLKSYTVTLQPGQNTELDSDPKVHILKWYQKWNRVCHYNDVVETFTANNRIQDDEDLSNIKNPTNTALYPYSNKPKANERVYMIIRATDYTTPTANFSNNIHGSFDLHYESRFTVLD